MTNYLDLQDFEIAPSIEVATVAAYPPQEKGFMTMTTTTETILFEGHLPEVTRTYRVTASRGKLRFYRKFRGLDGDCGEWFLEGEAERGRSWKRALKKHVLPQ